MPPSRLGCRWMGKTLDIRILRIRQVNSRKMQFPQWFPCRFAPILEMHVLLQITCQKPNEKLYYLESGFPWDLMSILMDFPENWQDFSVSAILSGHPDIYPSIVRFPIFLVNPKRIFGFMCAFLELLLWNLLSTLGSLGGSKKNNVSKLLHKTSPKAVQHWNWHCHHSIPSIHLFVVWGSVQFFCLSFDGLDFFLDMGLKETNPRPCPRKGKSEESQQNHQILPAATASSRTTSRHPFGLVRLAWLVLRFIFNIEKFAVQGVGRGMVT